MKKNNRFTKVISVILLIATLITLPGFMVGVSAINRSFYPNKNNLEFNDDSE